MPPNTPTSQHPTSPWQQANLTHAPLHHTLRPPPHCGNGKRCPPDSYPYSTKVPPWAGPSGVHTPHSPTPPTRPHMSPRIPHRSPALPNPCHACGRMCNGLLAPPSPLPAPARAPNTRKTQSIENIPRGGSRPITLDVFTPAGGVGGTPTKICSRVFRVFVAPGRSDGRLRPCQCLGSPYASRGTRWSRRRSIWLRLECGRYCGLGEME